MMNKHATPFMMKSRHLSYLWLSLAAVLMAFALPFTMSRWVIPLAAWLAPVFLLRFMRAQPVVRGVLVAWLVLFVTTAIVQQGVPPIPGLIFYVYALMVRLLIVLPYLADRLISPRLTGFGATLVFPLAATSLEYIYTQVGPFGSIGSLAYTQYGNLPLMQVVSVTGIWGITFLITWLASVANWAWERHFSWPAIRGGTLISCGILALVLLSGGARLALFPPTTTTVRVAGISPTRAVWNHVDELRRRGSFDTLFTGKASRADRDFARVVFTTVSDDLFNTTMREARAGAKIVLWPEVGAAVLEEDESGLIAQGSTVARTSGIYLEMGMLVYTQTAPFAQDKAVLLDPTGKVVWHYYKAHPFPGEPWLPGDGKVPTIATPFGRLATVICFDLDFPSLLRQAGQAGSDVVLLPSYDWQEIDPMHTQITTFRAIENGFSLVRQTRAGLSMTVDYEGRVLAVSDYFSSDQQVMIASVPIHGVHTIYAVIGDLFAWLSLMGLVILTAVAFWPRRVTHTEEMSVSPHAEHVF